MAAAERSPEAALAAALNALVPAGAALGAALSGGGDSLALTLLTAEWAAGRGARLETATVDHGLRAESAAEAEAAARRAEAAGLRAARLVWRSSGGRGWDGRGNLQEAAREARLRLLAEWARARGLSAILLGHTLDDQAETVLLALARGSGVDGLSAMPRARRAHGALWLRPLLGVSRAALRDWLRARGERWAEDPGNADPRFARIRARAALAALEPLGVTAERLGLAADHAARAREALEAATAGLAARIASVDALGAVRLARGGLLAAPEEVRLRLLTDALRAASGAARRPRFAAARRLAEALATTEASAGRTLLGCAIFWDCATVLIAREPAAAMRAVWDAPRGGGDESGGVGFGGAAGVDDGIGFDEPTDAFSGPRRRGGAPPLDGNAGWTGAADRDGAAPPEGAAPPDEADRSGGARDRAAPAPWGRAFLWDGRWRVSAPAGAAPGALGEAGEAALAAARREGIWTPPEAWRAAPRAARLSSPAFWRGGALIAAPAAAFGAGARAACVVSLHGV